jgi:hypothetical protein
MEIINVKRDFSNWLLQNAPVSYNHYLGGSINSVLERLNEISEFFPEQNFFEVNPNIVSELTQEIKFLFSTKERRKNSAFIAYDKHHSSGIPKAVMGKNNFIKFLKEKFDPTTTETNYWIFQGNPKVFDFASAIGDNTLDNFTVSAHKDKIKEGDKVIIWLSGEQPGCYALAKVTHAPKEVDVSKDDAHWKIEQPTGLKAGIKITHNLYNNPIHKEQIIDNSKLDNLNVGYQGTNFRATKEEYKALLELVDQKKNVSRKFIYDSLLLKMKNAGFTFEAEQETHGQNRKETEFKFTFPQLLKKFDQDGFNIRATKFYIKPLTDEPNCEIGFVTGKTSSLISEPIFSEPNSNDTHNDCPAWTNRDNDYAIDRLLKSITNYLRKQPMKHPLNQILFGPPGTGKTYKTKELAVSIIDLDFIKGIDPSTSNDEKRKLVINKYDEIQNQGQIVFTTFHQSMTYEDFIEGIKPIIRDKNIIYDIEEGVFKKLSDLAKDNWDAVKNSNSKNLAFDDAFLQLKEDWEENNDIKFPMKTEGKDFTIIGFTNKSIQFKKASGGTGHTLSINTLREAFYKKRKIRQTGVGIYYIPILKRLNAYESTTPEQELKSYVLIIDEINRGNVSAIFGELITLLEEDKRLGNSEAIEVQLPYSKDKFSVPSNLHIIGTMNTADRSIEALDSALRRRFEFEEMMPKYDVIDNVLNHMQYESFKLSDILKTINERITILINRDHQIGHSYFLKLKDSNDLEKDLKQIFMNKIIPLLQEYFFNDYIKIAMVLGEGFMDKDKYSNVTFAKNDSDYESDYENTLTYEIKKDINLSDAINKLMGKEEDA